MHPSNAAAGFASSEQLARKSWTAYIGIAALALALLLLSAALWESAWQLGAVALVIFSAFIIYRVLVLRSYELYCDAVGVWLYSGIMPWSKGIAGVKWRDLDEAVFMQTFWSWLFKSYSIRIGHRDTKHSEIVLTHMARGPEAAMKINQQQQQRARGNALT